MRIKIIKQARFNTCYECDNTASAGVTNWEEIPDEEYAKIRDAVTWANLNRKDDWTYFILVEAEDRQDIFASAQEFHDELKRIKEQREAEAAARKAKRAESSRQRKLKQLERLQKELGK